MMGPDLTPETDPELIKSKMDDIDLGNTTSVLMAQLCKEMGLNPRETTHQKFVETFTAIQKAKLDAEKYMQSQFISTGIVKTRKKRESK